MSVLGAGSVVTEYYLPALAATGIAETITVSDTHHAGLAIAAQLLPEARVDARDFRAVLSGPIDPSARGLAIIALPNTMHVEACELALRSGRDVLCEKPLSLSAADCRRVGDTAAALGRTLSVAMVRRLLPSWNLARQMIAGGEIGRLSSVAVYDQAPFSWRPRSLDFFAPGAGGILADMGVHYLDFLEQVLGPLAPVFYEDDWHGGNESTCSYRLAAGKTDVRLDLSRLNRGATHVRFVGEAGEIVLRKADERHVFVTPKGRAERRMALEHPFQASRWPADLHGAFCEMLAELKRSGAARSSLLADATQARRTAALIEWAYMRRGSGASVRAGRSAATGGDQILITGGTGFIGGHLVRRLDAGNARIECLVRSPATVANLARFDVALTQVDLLDPAAVRRAVAGKRIVYHLAYGRDGSDQAEVTVEGTKHVVEAAIAAGVEAVVVLSTAYVFGFPAAGGPVDETFPYRPFGGVYGTSKAAMERWCLERARSSGPTRIVVLNPTNVIGPGGGAYVTLPVALARQGAFRWIEGGRGMCNYTYVDNLIDALLAAAQATEAHGRRFIISDGARPWIDVLGPYVDAVADAVPSLTREQFAKLAGASARFRWPDLVRAIAKSSDVRAVARRSALVRRLGQVQPLRRLVLARRPAAELPEWARPTPATTSDVAPPAWLAELYHTEQTVFSAALAKEVLGWSPRVGLEEATARTLQWLRKAGHIGGDPMRAFGDDA